MQLRLGIKILTLKSDALFNIFYVCLISISPRLISRLPNNLTSTIR